MYVWGAHMYVSPPPHPLDRDYHPFVIDTNVAYHVRMTPKSSDHACVRWSGLRVIQMADPDVGYAVTPPP